MPTEQRAGSLGKFSSRHKLEKICDGTLWGSAAVSRSITTGHSKVVAGSQGTQDTDYSEVVEIRVGCMGQCYEFPPSIEMVRI